MQIIILASWVIFMIYDLNSFNMQPSNSGQFIFTKSLSIRLGQDFIILRFFLLHY